MVISFYWQTPRWQTGSTLVQDNQEKNSNVVTIRGKIRNRREKGPSWFGFESILGQTQISK